VSRPLARGAQPAVVEPAGLFRRALTVAVDGVLVLGLATAVALWWMPLQRLLPPRVLPLLDHGADLVLREWRLLLRLLILLGGVAVSYLAVFHLTLGTTPGERALGLRLLGPDGDPAGPLRVLLRDLLALPSTLLLGAGWTWAYVDRQRRSLHDRICGTHLARWS